MAPTHAELVESLRRRGYRLTPQRALILEVLSEAPGPLGVEEILRRVRRVYPYVDPATVYRTLKLLKRMDLVTEISGGGASRYELARERHHHLVCTLCGGVIDLPLRYLEPLKEALERDLGFQADLDHFSLQGVCAHCRAEG